MHINMYNYRCSLAVQYSTKARRKCRQNWEEGKEVKAERFSCPYFCATTCKRKQTKFFSSSRSHIKEDALGLECCCYVLLSHFWLMASLWINDLQKILSLTTLSGLNKFKAMTSTHHKVCFLLFPLPSTFHSLIAFSNLACLLVICPNY